MVMMVVVTAVVDFHRAVLLVAMLGSRLQFQCGVTDAVFLQFLFYQVLYLMGIPVSDNVHCSVV